MKIAFWLGMFAMTLLTTVFVWGRARLALVSSRLQAIEEVAAARGIGAVS